MHDLKRRLKNTLEYVKITTFLQGMKEGESNHKF